MIHKKEEVSKEIHRMAPVFWQLRVVPQWHTSFNKDTPPNPSQMVTSTLHREVKPTRLWRPFLSRPPQDLLSMAGWCLRLRLPFESHVFPHLPPQHACGECCGEACRLCLHGGLYHWSLADDHNWWERWQKCILHVTAKVPVQTLALTTCWRLLTTNYSRQAPFLQLYPLPSSHTGMLSLLWAPRNCSHSHRDMSQPVLLTYHCSYACLLFNLSRVKPGTISLLTTCLQISYLATRCKFVQ